MLKLRPVGVFCRDDAEAPQTEAEQHRRQSAYTSSQVGAKDLTLVTNGFESKGILLT